MPLDEEVGGLEIFVDDALCVDLGECFEGTLEEMHERGGVESTVMVEELSQVVA